MLREPRRGVAGLAKWVEIDVDGSVERATVQESQDNTELAGCNNERGTGVLHQCRMTQRDVQWCEMQGVVAAAQRSEREHLSMIEGASTSEGVSSPIGRSVGRSVTYFLVIELQCNSGQHDST